VGRGWVRGFSTCMRSQVEFFLKKNCINSSRTFDRTDILDSEYNTFMGPKDMRITRNVGDGKPFFTKCVEDKHFTTCSMVLA
jgi:hypothetical protein